MGRKSYHRQSHGKLTLESNVHVFSLHPGSIKHVLSQQNPAGKAKEQTEEEE